MAAGRRRVGGHAFLGTMPGRVGFREIVEACPDERGQVSDDLCLFDRELENAPRLRVAGLMSLFRRYIMKEMQDFGASECAGAVYR